MKELINYLQERGHTTIDELTAVRLSLLLLGAYSLTRLIVTDTFPLFARPRDWIKKRFPPSDTVWEEKPPRGVWKKLPDNRHYLVMKGHWFGDLIDCPWCAGYWVSELVWTGAYLFFPVLTLCILTPFAMRAFVGAFAGKFGG